MFHWICPECGREIPPAVKECPACDPKAAVVAEPVQSVVPPPLPVAASVPVASEPAQREQFVVSAAAPVELPNEPKAEAAPVLPNEPKAEAAPVLPNEPKAEAAPVLPNEPKAEPAPVLPNEPKAEAAPVLPNEPRAEAAPVLPNEPKAEAAPVLPNEPKAEAASVLPNEPKSEPKAESRPEPIRRESLPDPIVALAEQVRAAQQERQHPTVAAPAPPPELPGLQQLAAAVGVVTPEPEAGSPNEPKADVHVAAEPTVAEPVGAAVEPQVPAVAASSAPQPVALLAAPEEPRLLETTSSIAVAEPEALAPAAPVALAGPEPVAEPVIRPLGQPEPVPEEVKAARPHSVEPVVPEVRQVAPKLPIMPPSAQVPRTSAATGATDAAGPVPPVLKDMAGAAELPRAGSRLRLAPLQDYTAAAGAALRPAVPQADIRTPESGPRITLPGPALPPALVRLQNANPVTVIRGQMPPRRGLPGWLVSLSLMIGIPVAGAALLLYFQPVSHPSADTKPAATAEAPQPQVPAPAVSAAAPLAQMVEVTGFRIVVDFNKKSEIHYLVVNHSPADLSDMTVFVTLRTGSAKPGQPPVCRFSFRAPGLGPFESKEMVSTIEKLPRSVALPEWQDLRAEVQVGQ
jgi:hypothetical protein